MSQEWNHNDQWGYADDQGWHSSSHPEVGYYDQPQGYSNYDDGYSAGYPRYDYYDDEYYPSSYKGSGKGGNPYVGKGGGKGFSHGSSSSGMKGRPYHTGKGAASGGYPLSRYGQPARGSAYQDADHNFSTSTHPSNACGDATSASKSGRSDAAPAEEPLGHKDLDTVYAVLRLTRAAGFNKPLKLEPVILSLRNKADEMGVQLPDKIQVVDQSTTAYGLKIALETCRELVNENEVKLIDIFEINSEEQLTKVSECNLSFQNFATYERQVDKKLLAAAQVIYFEPPRDWPKEMNGNTAAFSAALALVGLRLVGEPKVQGFDVSSGTQGTSISLHVMAPGQNMENVPWHMVKFIEVYSNHKAAHNSGTGEQTRVYTGQLSLKKQDLAKFGICKPHFRKRQEGVNSIGCEVCNQPKKPKQKTDHERTWKSLQIKYAAAAAAMEVQDCPDWTAGRKCKRGIACAKTYAHDPEKAGMCSFYTAGKECKYASQCPFGPSGHWKPPPAAEEPQQPDAGNKRARPNSPDEDVIAIDEDVVEE